MLTDRWLRLVGLPRLPLSIPVAGRMSGLSHLAASASDRGRSGNSRVDFTSPSERPSAPGTAMRSASLGIHSRGFPSVDMTRCVHSRSPSLVSLGPTLPQVGRVPPSWFLTTSAACSAMGVRVCCNPLPAGVHRVFADRDGPGRSRTRDRRVPAVQHPPKNSPRQQPYRITAASSFLPLPRWATTPEGVLARHRGGVVRSDHLHTPRAEAMRVAAREPPRGARSDARRPKPRCITRNHAHTGRTEVRPGCRGRGRSSGPTTGGTLDWVTLKSASGSPRHRIAKGAPKCIQPGRDRSKPVVAMTASVHRG